MAKILRSEPAPSPVAPPFATARRSTGRSVRSAAGLDGKRRVVLIEFNELCPALLDRWMAAGHLPNFSRFHAGSQVFVSDADAKAGPYLEPWIQWYSMHTGLAYDQHGVFHLTDGPHAGHADIWGMLLAAGKRVGCCGSMNAKGFAAPGSYFLPDPWCSSQASDPAELHAFYRVVSQYVQEYTNPAFRLGLGDYGRFAWFMARHGLRPGTVASLARQLLAEKTVDRKAGWRRAPLLDRLQFDLFRHFQRRLRPDFATYFVNSTAHYQHAYWRHMDPEAFKVRPASAEIETYGGAVLYGYRQMDRLLGDFFALEDDDVMLVFATGLSQQPFLKGEAAGGHTYYRAHDIEALLARLGIACTKVYPAMTHQYLAHFADQAAADEARRRLATVRCEGEQVFDFSPSESRTVYFGCSIFAPVPEAASVTLAAASNQTTPFYDLFYHIAETKSGMHHPDGALWFKTGRHARHRDTASILDVLPTLLEFFGVEPGAAGAGLRGTSLLPRFAEAPRS